MVTDPSAPVPTSLSLPQSPRLASPSLPSYCALASLSLPLFLSWLPVSFSSQSQSSPPGCQFNFSPSYPPSSPSHIAPCPQPTPSTAPPLLWGLAFVPSVFKSDCSSSTLPSFWVPPLKQWEHRRTTTAYRSICRGKKSYLASAALRCSMFSAHRIFREFRCQPLTSLYWACVN